MSIDEYFKKINLLKIKKNEKLREYIESMMVLNNTFGSNLNGLPKAKGKTVGLDDLLLGKEKLSNEYETLEKKYKEERIKIISEINNLNNSVYSLIIIYFFLDYHNDKDVIYALSKYHNINYSESYFRKLKSKAIKEFTKMIQKGTKKNKKEQNDTKKS